MDRLTQNFGFGIVPKQVMKDSNLSIQSKAVYSYLCSYAGNKDTAFPSIPLITYELNISKDTFYKYMNELKDKLYIETFQAKENGQFSHSIYRLLPCPKSSDTVISDTVSSDTTFKDTNKNNLNKNNLNKNNIKPIKIKYADRVMLTEIEYNKLVEQYGKKIIDSKITDLDLWKGSKGKKTSSDYLTILAWLRKDIKTEIPKGRQKDFGSAY